jgi:uncharacterized protein YbbC (DUF1343 family)
MVLTGLERLLGNFPPELRKKRLGVLCHAASVTSRLTHIVDELMGRGECRIGAIFGPQHGLSGETQDNMVEWEGFVHPRYNVPVFSLYGAFRKPLRHMLEGLDGLIVDLQDVGARPYTYVWTLKLCMEACAGYGVPLRVLDRPNPAGAAPFDGPVLEEGLHSFVGGAPIPLCHRMTIGEIAELLKKKYYPGAALNVVRMEGWRRGSLWPDTGLPWVMPSPNMPSADTAIVYPGMVLLEATNLSEGRGTTRPFELFGAPFLDAPAVIRAFLSMRVPGAILREHSFIPTFQKWQGQRCGGIFIHVTDPRQYQPVTAALALIRAVMDTAGGKFSFNPPPYEYETEKMPFDILAGTSAVRESLMKGESIGTMTARYENGLREFVDAFAESALYPE